MPLGMRTAENKAVTGDQRMGTSGTEGGNRGGPLLRGNGSEEINATTLTSSIISAFLYRKHRNAWRKKREDVHRTQVFQHPGERNFGKVSFRWESLPKDRAFLMNTKAGDCVWRQRKTSNEVTVSLNLNWHRKP